MIPSAVQFLIDGAHQAPSADNSQPWSFSWDGETLVLRYVPGESGLDVFGRDSHCEQLTMGAVVENIVQLADAVGMGGEWDLGHQGDIYLRFRPDAPDADRQLDRRHPVFRRHTNRFSFKEQPVADDAAHAIESLAEGPCAAVVYRDNAALGRLANLIRRASSMRFRNRRLHEWFAQTLRFTPEQVARGDGLDVRTIELPPGGSALLRLIMDWRRMAFLNRLGMYRLLSGIESQAIDRSVALVAFVGQDKEAFRAGRLLERVWLSLDGLGLSAQPYYVLTDQLVRSAEGSLPEDLVGEGRRLAADAQDFFGHDSFPHMLLRVGYARRSAPLSRRLPLESVIEEAR